MSNVDHPAHYGGADNPYEAIKVMEAWLTPEEFVGGLKFSFFTYQARARRKNGLEDHEKAAWYQARLIEFIKRTGYSEKPAEVPLPVFWTEDNPDPTDDEYDCLVAAAFYEPVAVHSNIYPHVRWLVRFPTADAAGEYDGEDFSTFATHADAQAFCDEARSTQDEETERRTGAVDAEPVIDFRIARGRDALYAAAEIVIEDGIVTKSRDGTICGRPARNELFAVADLVIVKGEIIECRLPPAVPRQLSGARPIG
ncbi:MAG: hypothetical protein DI527_00310 [Chelatococcus sp.]|nr:MAG: hypothetical protein DI527_00310 [Chelatococcus sp.]